MTINVLLDSALPCVSSWAGPIVGAHDRSSVRAQAVSASGERLPEPYRSAVHAVDIDGMTHLAAADLAGISVPGMKSRVQRGRRQLRELLTDCCTVELSATRAVTDYRSPSGCAPGDCP